MLHSRVFLEASDREIRGIFGNGVVRQRAVIEGSDGISRLVEAGDSLSVEGKFKVYVQQVYEEALAKFLDLERSEIKRSTIVQLPDGSLLKLEKGEVVGLIDIEGYNVCLLVDVGDAVMAGQRIAQTVSRRFTVRSVRSPTDGVIFYIGQILVEKPGHYLILVKPRGLH